MDFILSYFSEEWIYAIGWTVLHSFWQAGIIAVIMGIILQTFQHKPAKLRYEIATLSMFMVFVFALCTFLYIYDTAYDTAGILASGLGSDAIAIVFEEGSSSWVIYSNTWAGYFNQHMPLIVSVWIMGSLFFLLRLFGGYAYVQRLRYHHNYFLPDHWQDKLNVLIARTPIRKPIQLLESALVRVPMVIGFFKPAILLPIGVINTLSDEEVEAILAHELGHIYRNDYIQNILISFFEALFYYNPAVWWISANIRTERENCCDDIGIQLCGNPLTYAKALVSIQDMHLSAPSFAMSFSGNKNQLLYRIKRILNQPHNKSNIMEKLMATGLVVFAVLLLSFSSGNSYADSMEHSNEEETEMAEAFEKAYELRYSLQDTLPTKKKKSKHRIIKTTDDQEIEMTIENGEITELEIDGEEIPESEFEEYNDLTEELMEEMNDIPVPPAPPAPPSNFGTTFPAPPTPPSAPSATGFFSRGRNSTKIITSERDEDGQTIITIEADGNEEPIEIIVDDEKQLIFIDGNELETGDTAIIVDPNMQSFSFFQGGNSSSPNIFKLDGSAFTFPESNFDNHIFDGHWEIANQDFLLNNKIHGLAHLDEEERKALEEELAQIAEERAEAKEEYEEVLKEYKENRRELLAEAREHAEEARAQQRELQIEQRERLREVMEQQRELQMEQRERIQERLREQELEVRGLRGSSERSRAEARGRFRGKNTSAIIEDHLIKDGLISSRSKYSFQLSNKKFKVNGKKMSKELHQKYVEIYRGITGTRDSNSNFNISVSNN